MENFEITSEFAKDLKSLFDSSMKMSTLIATGIMFSGDNFCGMLNLKEILDMQALYAKHYDKIEQMARGIK